MTICPIAIAVGCKKCPAFKICPAKRLLGDMPLKPTPTPTPEIKAKASARPAAKAATKPRTAKPKSAPKKKQPTAAGK